MMQSRKEHEEKQLAKVGAAVPSGQNPKNAENNDDENEAAKELQKSMTTAEKKQDLVQTPDPPATRMAMRKKGMHSTMHLKMKRES